MELGVNYEPLVLSGKQKLVEIKLFAFDLQGITECVLQNFPHIKDFPVAFRFGK